MAKLKVVEIISDLHHRGGAEVFTLALSHRLAHDPDVDFYFISLYANPNPMFQQDLEEWRGHLFFCNKKKGFDPLASLRLRRIIKRIKPDVVHSHLWVMNTFRLAFGCKPQKFRLVHTLHSVPALDTRPADCRAKRKLAKHNAVTFVGISDEITASSKTVYETQAVRTIYNGIEFQPIIEKEKEFDFVCVANFSKNKNHALLLRCFASIVEKYPQARLACCGSGDLLEPSKKLAEELGIAEKVAFAGYVSDVGHYLSVSRCFILSSLYEGNPLSILEAMHAGLPIIAPKVGGIPDVVSSNEGILFEADNQLELAEAMMKCLQEPNSFTAMGKRGQMKVEAFEFGHCYQEYKDLFFELAAR